ncbi:hypothetical protein LTR29_017933 [Friedmanniomyces endolithicus]|nr:hypothetical protein LTR29_017933 [Friedmanniomyces endolithicus]
MTKTSPWTLPQYQHLMTRVDPNPRDPGNGSVFTMKSPDAPRPSKPVQPRDDGQSRHVVVGPHPRDDGSNQCFSSGSDPNPRPPKPVQPRDPGPKRLQYRDPKDPTPRDPGN